MNVSTRQGNLLVAHSETVLVYNNEPTTIVLDGGYTITLKYEDSSTSENNHGISDAPTDAGVLITLKNFTNPLGTATASPIAFAKKNDQTLYITFSAHLIGNAKMVHYSICVGE